MTNSEHPDEEPHVPLTLLVHNVYGGGNLSGGEAYTTALLSGNAHIKIGGKFDNGAQYRMGKEVIAEGTPHVMCIHGNLYGDGNYSLIDGSSTITVDGYEQYGDHSLWSIQRADEVHISDSILEIKGSSDGGSLNLTQELTLNRIDNLILSKDSHLILHSETSKIGSYSSTTDGTTLATRNDCSTIVMDGKVTGYNINMQR